MAAIHGSSGNDNLTEVIDRIVDRGITVGTWARLSLPEIEKASPSATVLIAPVNTYLHYARGLALARCDTNILALRAAPVRSELKKH